MTTDTDNLSSRFRHGPVFLDRGTYQVRVWAPHRESLRLVLYRDGEEFDEVAMRPESHGVHVSPPRLVSETHRYGIRIGTGPVRPDPATRWQPEGIHLPSALWDARLFGWSDADWRGIPRSDLVIYEVHVGTFTDAGTFDAIIPRLPELRDLGVNAIELMPVAQFPGDRNWGYDGVHPFAPQNTYGGPGGLQRLVNECHRAGFAVILDVVYNHLGPEGNYLSEFGPYLTDHYRTPWGAALNFDQPGSDGVRAFVLENVQHWIRDFHIDGLRLDAVHAIHDSAQTHILNEITCVANAAGSRSSWPLHVIAESDANDARLLDPRDTGSGLDAVWNDDFHHAVHALLTGERHGYYVDYGSPRELVKTLNQTFVFGGSHSTYRGRTHGTKADRHSGDRFVVCIQNHDQIGNRICGERLAAILSPAKQRLAAGLLLTSPYLPLLFMGEEYAETRPFTYFCSFLDPDLAQAVRHGRSQEHSKENPHARFLDPQAEESFARSRLGWSWPEQSHAAGLRRLYQDLIAARRDWPALRDFHNRRAELLPNSETPRVIRFVRAAASHRASGALVAFFNLTATEQRLDLSLADDSVLLMCSEGSRYRGSRRPGDQVDSLYPYEFQIYGPIAWKPL
jgi:maltooligosyltrehalose trehalohydrolase